MSVLLALAITSDAFPVDRDRRSAQQDPLTDAVLALPRFISSSLPQDPLSALMGPEPKKGGSGGGGGGGGAGSKLLIIG